MDTAKQIAEFLKIHTEYRKSCFIRNLLLGILIVLMAAISAMKILKTEQLGPLDTDQLQLALAVFAWIAALSVMRVDGIIKSLNAIAEKLSDIMSLEQSGTDVYEVHSRKSEKGVLCTVPLDDQSLRRFVLVMRLCQHPIVVTKMSPSPT